MAVDAKKEFTMGINATRIKSYRLLRLLSAITSEMVEVHANHGRLSRVLSTHIFCSRLCSDNITKCPGYNNNYVFYIGC